MSIRSQDKQTLDYQEGAVQQFVPPLTPATIQRAREGLAAAHELSANNLVHEELLASEAIANGRSALKSAVNNVVLYCDRLSTAFSG